MKHLTELQLIEYAASSPADSEAREHLDQCESCRQVYEQTKLVYNSLEDFAVPQVGDLTAKVRDGIAARRASAWKRFAYDLIRIAAAIIVSVSLGYAAASISTQRPQSDSITAARNQSAISFAGPAVHIASLASGEAQ